LSALEDEGVVQREETGQREVWYRLTPKGQALEPVIDALLVWGIDHALGGPRPGEAIHPGRVVDSVVRYLERRGARPAGPAAWALRFGEDRAYTIRFDGERWSRQRAETAADVVIETSPERWAKFLAADRDRRRRWLAEQGAKGTRKRIEELVSAFG